MQITLAILNAIIAALQTLTASLAAIYPKPPTPPAQGEPTAQVVHHPAK